MLASQDAQKRHSEVAANTIDGCPRVPPRSRMSRSANSSSAVRDMLGSDGPLLVSSCDHLSGVISFHNNDYRPIAFGDVPDSFMMDFIGTLSSMSNFEARRQ